LNNFVEYGLLKNLIFVYSLILVNLLYVIKSIGALKIYNMKKIHIIGIVLIAVAIAILMSLSEDVSTFTTFSKAIETGKVVKISGHLSKDKELYYNPQENPNYFTFYLKDSENKERKVILNSAKPQDFERSESIVLTGKMVGDEFHASDMLMKCPSKYKDEEVYIKSKKGKALTDAN
jgi:cytochrome c-type biogenesis protein CcmE